MEQQGAMDRMTDNTQEEREIGNDVVSVGDVEVCGDATATGVTATTATDVTATDAEKFTGEHYHFMLEAIAEARKAEAILEVPIGAVVVKDGEVVGRGYNLRETDHDPTAHAEMIAIRDASKHLGGWRLTGCELYVTIEPCPMCAGAILNARIDRVYYGAKDPKAGCAGSLMDLLQDGRFNHVTEVIPGLMEAECAELMRSFFRKLRK